MRAPLYLAATVALAPMIVLTNPAQAGLQLFFSVTPGSPASIQCPGSGSPAPCKYNAAGDETLQFSPSPFPLNGVTTNGALYAATGTPSAPGVDGLTETALAVINTTAVEKTLRVVTSDIDFIGPASTFTATTSGTFVGSLDSTMTVNWYADPTNTQGADASGNTPGTLLATFSTTATSADQSFSFNKQGSFSASGPFSMTEEAIYTLAPHGELLSRGVSLTTSVPETSTWAMMALGFAGLGFAGYRSSRSRIAVAAT